MSKSDASTPIREPRLQDLLAYWRSRRGARIAPARADIDPLDLPATLLPFVLIAEVLEGGARYRYRLVGTAMRQAFGYDPTGRDVHDALLGSPAYRDYVIGLYAKAVQACRPLYSETHYLIEDGAPEVVTQRLQLPLSNDGQQVQVMLSGQITLIPPRFSDNPFLHHKSFRPGVEMLLD